MKRDATAALYLRVSTKDRQHPANQEAPLRTWCKETQRSIYRVYVDRVSGSDDERPAFLEMMKDATARKFGIVVCWSMDRFSREGIEPTLRYVARLRAAGVHFYSLTEEYFRTAGPAGELLLAVCAWVADFERRRRIERVNAGLDRARSQGVQLGRRRSTVDMEEIRRLHSEGHGVRAIAKKVTNASRATIQRRLKEITANAKAADIARARPKGRTESAAAGRKSTPAKQVRRGVQPAAKAPQPAGRKNDGARHHRRVRHKP